MLCTEIFCCGLPPNCKGQVLDHGWHLLCICICIRKRICNYIFLYLYMHCMCVCICMWIYKQICKTGKFRSVKTCTAKKVFSYQDFMCSNHCVFVLWVFVLSHQKLVLLLYELLSLWCPYQGVLRVRTAWETHCWDEGLRGKYLHI